MKIASWNVNSIRARLTHVQNWLDTHKVDVLCLQELKCETEKFPLDQFPFYKAVVHGQKAYNGVAVLAREPLKDHHIPHLHDESRILVTPFRDLDIVTIYAPNGNPLGTEKFDKKMKWTRGLIDLLKTELKAGKDFLVLGDFNIIPEEIDAAYPHHWKRDALFQPESRALYREMLHLGLTDAWRSLHPEERGYTFWDYFAGSWERNDGIRIDHVLLSPGLADRLEACEIDTTPRNWEKPSDHVPIIVTLKD